MEVSCPNCTFLNATTAMKCEMCEQSIIIELSTQEDENSPDPGEKRLHSGVEKLSCLKCTYDNSITALSCGMCGHSLDIMINSGHPLPLTYSLEYDKSLSLTSCSYPNGGGSSSASSDTSEVVQDDLIPLLDEALREQRAEALMKNHKKRRLQPVFISTFKLCSPLVPHVTQRGYEGDHWSCGYRNIQMMCHCLRRMRMRCLRECVKSDNCGIFGRGIPDVTGLQVWIERAWSAGFDHMGAEQFGGALLGKDEWIGATECATLLRYLGFRARIVDFHTPKLTQTQKRMRSTLPSGAECGPLTSSVVRWVKDYFDMKHPFLQPIPGAYAGCECNCSTSRSTQGCMQHNEGQTSSSLPPLYFQHQGHSRTIVGYEQTSTKFSLLLFDPSSSGCKLRLKLEQQDGWQVMIKRSAHTLTQGQFQIVYILPGELLKPNSPDYEDGKVLSSSVYS